MKEFSISTKELKYIGRWVPWSIVIGIGAGLGAIAFYLLLQAASAFFQGYVSGYYPVLPAGEPSIFSVPATSFRLWVLALIPAVGGLIAGLIIYSFAPEAEGHGTDAVIDAFHKKSGEIRRRVPIVKTIASAITIGSGGSAGREGPIAQIGGGFGSFIASRLKMSDRERRVMMLCGAAAGIGAIFKAPLGGALFGIEVLYKKDFEMESMVPAIVSSVMAYAVFCSFPNIGWGPIFTMPYDYTFNHPYELIFYAILGVACAAAAIFYIKVFYGTRGLFRRLNIPNHLKPAIGGAILGLLVLLVGYIEPEALDGILGMGYGCIQLAINVKCGLFILLVVAIAKIFATSFTIGSGGSGGVFGPSLVIGAMLGGLFGWLSLYLSQLFFPGAEIITEATLSAFVLVGMAAFIAGAAKVPIAAILMISEMAGSYSLLVPLMLTSVVAYTLSGGWTIYENQEKTRKESPAHSREFIVDILEGIKVKDAYMKDVLTIPADKTVKEGLYFAEEMGHMTYPVVDKDGKMVGITTIMALEKQREEGADYRKIGLICVKEQDVIVAYPDEFLEDVLHKMDTYNVGRLPVMKKEREEEKGPEELVGIISRSDIIREHCRRWSRVKGESS
uniref:Voltage-gated ClC-type chloride channel ClcB n=1 Tax=Candidatus Methanophagaceae archaeon ANME-1 ERB6 TaxID=2759912 RepID=A0A7G9YWU0_9EURY|nr:voltage-gated ClC-type chloride channel ClcB [Methanosarcinales archaeon ANME-1 ERB6]